MVEHLTENQGVASSNLALGTTRLGNGSAEAVVDAVGPVSGRNRKHQLDHLLLVKVLAKRIEVGVVNVPGVADE